MKEYWVNVLRVEFCSISGKLKHKSKQNAIEYSNRVCNNPIYRLHVREFDTREAKELYLKMKYDRVISYRGSFYVPNTEGIFQ